MHNYYKISLTFLNFIGRENHLPIKTYYFHRKEYAMQQYKSPLRKLWENFLGFYYDYRKILAIFCCYSLVGTGLILGAASALGEDTILYRLAIQEEENSEHHHEALVAEAAASKSQSIKDVLKEIKNTSTSYSLTGTISDSGLEKAENNDSSSLSQQEAQESTAATAEKDSHSQKDKQISKSHDSKKKSVKKNKSASLTYDISKYSKQEIQILERIVEAEAGDQTLKGRIMVANVVLNRVASSEFPNTIKKVVFQKNNSIYQFSPIKDGRYYDITVSKKTKKAVEKAFQSKDLTDGALYFMSRSGSSKKNIKWFDSSLTRITSYGCHEFFK